MRGVAAIAVVCYHASFLRILEGDDSLFAAIAFRGWFGVDFFFVLSAFLLSGPFLKTEFPPLKRYFWRRFMRLVPPYYATFFLIAIMFNAWFYFRDYTTDFLLHLSFLHGFSPATILTVNPVFWTLALEFQFYLLLPLIVLGFRGNRWKVSLPAALVISILWRSLSGDTDVDSFWIRNQFPGYLIHFCLGISIRKLPFKAWAPTRVAPAAAVLIILGLGLIQPRGFHEYPWEATTIANLLLRPLLAIGFAGLIWSLANTQAFSNIVWQAFGAMSYSVYLVHIVSQLYFTRFAWGTTWWALLVLPIAMSAGYYFLIEKPSLKLVSFEKFTGPGR